MLENLQEKAIQFLPYIEDLRRRLYRSVVLFCILFVIGFMSASFFIRHILLLVHLTNVTIATTSPFQFADLAMDCGFFLASLVVFPYVAYMLFSFVAPGLTWKEKRKFFMIVPVSIFLFVVGFLYGVVIFYYALTFLAQVNTDLGIANIWDISMFMSQIFFTASLLGILFEFPVVLTFLIKVKFLSKDYLKKKRKVAIASIFIFVSLLPPTDGISLILMSVPLIGLYEMTLLLNK